jgi:hypothetical protein
MEVYPILVVFFLFHREAATKKTADIAMKSPLVYSAIFLKHFPVNKNEDPTSSRLIS